MWPGLNYDRKLVTLWPSEVRWASEPVEDMDSSATGSEARRTERSVNWLKCYENCRSTDGDGRHSGQETPFLNQFLGWIDNARVQRIGLPIEPRVRGATLDIGVEG